ncbi:MAG: hypothetical protein HZB79_01290 [Deltaproteobacteria bacterium]|nr:hypothetical protein [Deltaproteobacteria bacterium]
MHNIKVLIDKYSHILVFTFFLIFWFSIFMGSGSVFSGYHSAEDFKFVEIYNDLVSTQNDIIAVSKKWVGWMNGIKRFNPVYYIYAVMEVFVFGTNFNMMLAYTSLLAVFTSLFLFLFSRKIGFSLLESVLFSLLSLAGVHAVIWWTAVTNEAFSMFLLSLTLIFMAYSAHSKKNRFVHEILFVVFAILVSLSKESFLLIIPALVFWKIWLYQERHTASWVDAIKNNIVSAIILFLSISIEIFIILKWIGTNPYGPTGGAGISRFEPLSYLILFKDVTLSISTIGLGLVLLAGILLTILADKDTHNFLSKIINFSKELSCPIVLFFLITIPQIIIYSKVGFPYNLASLGRYIVPLILGYSILLIYVIRFLRENNTRYFIRVSDKNKRPLFLLCSIGIFVGLFFVLFGGVFLYSQDMRLLFFSSLGKAVPYELLHVLKYGIFALSTGVFIIIAALILRKRRGDKVAVVNIMFFLAMAAIFYKTMLTFAGAYEYALEGKKRYWLQQSVKTNTKPNDIILIVGDQVLYPEPVMAAKEYLRHAAKRERIYINHMSLNDSHSGDEKFRMEEDVNYIIILGGLKAEQKFLNASQEWFNSRDFVRDANSIFITYYKTHEREI